MIKSTNDYRIQLEMLALILLLALLFNKNK